MGVASGHSYALGVDYGTNSVRALIVDTASGDEIATGVYSYEGGEEGVHGDPQDPNVARQSPGEYEKGFLESVRAALVAAKDIQGFDRGAIVGIGIDTTGSTPIPVDARGVPLAKSPRFADDPAAQAWLWKDHTAFAEAAEITDLAQSEPYLAKCGGVYSSEWFWSKILHCARSAPEVFEAAYSWVECCDYVPAFLTGRLDPGSIKRSICAAGHKAMFSDEWGGLPSAAFLNRLDPRLGPLRNRLYDQAHCADEAAGHLSQEIAIQVGLSPGIPVAVGAFDAHLGAVGSGIRPGTLVKIMGTSTCDIMVGDEGIPDIPGVCGIVPGSVIPGLVGIEAGQSAVGDLFNWFVKHLSPASAGGVDAHEALSQSALELKPGESGLLALDWNNGNRTVLVDPLLSGLLIGQTLQTSAPEIYRALIEATAFGALTIIERIGAYGVGIDEVVICGGIAEKSPLTMQIYADVLDRPMKLSRSAQTCALGAAIFGSVVGGAHPNVSSAQEAMTGTKPHEYNPNPLGVETYRELYRLYRVLHDAFGLGQQGDLRGVMKELIRIRTRVRAR